MATTVWADFISGQIQENPLSNVATTLTMSGRLQDLPTIASPNEAYLTIDPEGVDVLAGSGTEVVKVSAYTHAAGTSTIARGQRGTTARPHSQGVKIVLSWMAEDVKTTIQVEGADYHTAKKLGFDGDANITITPTYSAADDKVELSFALIVDPVWHVVGAGGEPAVATGWSAAGASKLRFCKQADGFVTLEGVILCETADIANEVIFTLPAGYRPPETFYWMAYWEVAGPENLQVHTDGTVHSPSHVSVGAQVNISLRFSTS